MANQTIQKSNFDPKRKAVVSLVFGLISVIPVVMLLIAFISPWEVLRIFAYLFIVFPSYILGLIFAILSLIFGIMGLKSSKKKFAVAGIIFSTINLILLGITIYIYNYFSDRSRINHHGQLAQ